MNPEDVDWTTPWPPPSDERQAEFDELFSAAWVKEDGTLRLAEDDA